MGDLRIDDDDVLTPLQIFTLLPVVFRVPRRVKMLIFAEAVPPPLLLGNLSLDVLAAVAEAVFFAWSKATWT